MKRKKIKKIYEILVVFESEYNIRGIKSENE